MLDLTEIKRLRELKRRYMSINWRDDLDFPYKEYQALRDKWDPIDVTPLLIAELEALRSELSEQCRVSGQGAERELKLMTEMEALRKERDGLRTALEIAQPAVLWAYHNAPGATIRGMWENADYVVHKALKEGASG